MDIRWRRATALARTLAAQPRWPDDALGCTLAPHRGRRGECHGLWRGLYCLPDQSRTPRVWDGPRREGTQKDPRPTTCEGTRMGAPAPENYRRLSAAYEGLSVVVPAEF